MTDSTRRSDASISPIASARARGAAAARRDRWRDGMLTAAAFGLVAALVFGAGTGTRIGADHVAEVALAR